MIECIFTVDCEIYGNGEGSLKDLVYEPAAKMIDTFLKHGARFVPFIEIAELEMIDTYRTDPFIEPVKEQIRFFHHNGFELGLHIHPQWYNGRYNNGKWQLDYQEYNLCTRSPRRIEEIIERAIRHLRSILETDLFVPCSFRAGNWLIQPTHNIAKALSACGIKIDSSVFKGGLQYQHNLDYRRAPKRESFWKFQNDVTVPDPEGEIVELPIHTQMVPFWKVISPKRIGLLQKAPSGMRITRKRLHRLRDLTRFWFPLKFDLCRMTLNELTRMVERAVREEEKSPNVYRPIVAIGHTKDLVDLETIDSFLSYLNQKKIQISTFQDVYPKCLKCFEEPVTG